MFKINDYRKTDSNIPLIVDNYEILHFDEYPILYIGTNEYGNQILGTLAYEDEEDYTYRYFHTIIRNNILDNFLNKEISYLSILENSKSTFIIDKDINDKVIEVFQIPVSEIPEDFLPHKSSFCPDYGSQLGFDYSVSLHGQIADKHEAFNDPLKKITESFFEIIDDAIGSLKELNLKHQIVHKPSAAGSFKINFLIKLPGYHNIFIKKNDISNYLAEYVSYCIDDLHKDVDNLKKKKNDQYVLFDKLSNMQSEIYQKNSIILDDEKLKTTLVKNVNETLEEVERISDEIGNGFKEIEIKSRTIRTENEILVGFIDKSKAQKITNATEYILESTTNNLTEDISERGFRVIIYNLNTDSRVGNAYVKNDDDPNLMDKPRIEILGDEELTESMYTESLHLNKWIEVRARGKKVKGRYKRLSIMGKFK